jgi:radical SAM superfamily enzyme YgiQ (UPF0313 family)
MTKDDIVKLAIEHTVSGLKFDEDGLVRFAKLVAQHEREACAKIAEIPDGEYEVVVACGTEPTLRRIPKYLNWQDIVKAIRARGQK